MAKTQKQSKASTSLTFEDVSLSDNDMKSRRSSMYSALAAEIALLPAGPNSKGEWKGKRVGIPDDKATDQKLSDTFRSNLSQNLRRQVIDGQPLEITTKMDLNAKTGKRSVMVFHGNRPAKQTTGSTTGSTTPKVKTGKKPKKAAKPTDNIPI